MEHTVSWKKYSTTTTLDPKCFALLLMLCKHIPLDKLEEQKDEEQSPSIQSSSSWVTFIPRIATNLHLVSSTGVLHEDHDILSKSLLATSVPSRSCICCVPDHQLWIGWTILEILVDGFETLSVKWR